MNFPCFTSGTIASHGYTQIVDLGGPVHVGGVWINPGDLLHGDRNGLAIIPLALAEKLANACPDFVAAEGVVLDYLKAGKVTAAGYAAARNECQRRIGELAKKLKS